MIYKITSSQRVVAKLYRDLRLSDSNYVSDIFEWIGEAMNHIRVFPSLERKVEEFDVEMHRFELPSDLAKIEQAARTFEGKDDLYIMEYNASHFPQSLHTRDSPNKGARDQQNRYIINMNYMETSFEEGIVVLAYLAYPTDDDGYPMIPDEVSFDEAFKWYVALRMAEGGWKHPAGLAYEAIEQRWHHYCAQARQKAKMPDIDQYEKFMQMWVRLAPDYTRHKFGFEQHDKLAQDYVNPEDIVVRGVDQMAGFGESEDESPSPSPS